MLIQSDAGTLRVQLRRDFGPRDSTRLLEAFGAFGPLSRVVVRFSSSDEMSDASLAHVASALAAHGGELALEGLTLHQTRLLRYLGVERLDS